jgi:hypothetical protein
MRCNPFRGSFVYAIRLPQKEPDMTFNVLVATPGDDEWTSIVHGIRRQRPEAAILRVKDGEQAMRFLFHRGLLTDAPETPDLVVLGRDLWLVPTEALVDRLRQHPRTELTPVIIVGRGRRKTDWAMAERFDHQHVVVLGGNQLQEEVADAVQRLCDVPLRLAMSEFESQMGQLT